MARIIFESNKCNNIELEERDITIDDNGTYAITPNEGYAGMSKVDVNVGVDTLQGLNFEGVYDAEQANEINQYYKDGIEYANQIKAENPNPSGNWSAKFQKDLNLIFFPQMDLSNVTNMSLTFNAAKHMLYSFCDKLDSISLLDTFNGCVSLLQVRILGSVKVLSWTFNGCVSLCSVEFSNISTITSADGAFNNCESIKNAVLPGWKQANISLVATPLLSAVSIHYIIQNAINVADGATARTLNLHADAKTNWQNSEYYAEDLAILSTKGITIA